MKKKIIIIIVIIAILLIGGGVTTILLNSSSNSTPKENEVERESKKAVVDNLNTNIEDTLRAQRIYKKVFRFGSAGVGKMGIHYIVTVDVENIGTTPTEHQHLDLTFLSNTGRVLGTVEIEVPELQPGEKVRVESDSLNEKIYEAFDYKISKVKQAKIEDK